MKKLLYIVPIALVLGACGQVADSGTPFSSRDGEWQAAWQFNRAGPLFFAYVVLQALYRALRLLRPSWQPPRRLELALAVLVGALFLNWLLLLAGW